MSAAAYYCGAILIGLGIGLSLAAAVAANSQGEVHQLRYELRRAVDQLAVWRDLASERENENKALAKELEAAYQETVK